MSTLKQTKTMTGSTSSSLWTWKQIVYEYFDDDYITNNRSRIVVESYLGRPSGQSTQSFGGTASINITCNGEARSTSKSWNYGANHIAGGGWFLIQSETFYVGHNADGTKSISVSSSLSTSAFNPNSASASGDITLTTIPRATACPNLDGYIESSAPVSLNPASSTFKHRIYYSYNGKTGYYPSSSGFFSNSGSMPLDTSFYSYTPSSSGTGSITLYTYDSSGNLIGSKDGSITIRCDRDKCKPIISLTIEDSNVFSASLTGNSSNLIKGYSNARITYTITTRNSATLKSKTLNGGNLGNSPYTISNVSTNSFSIYAVDSRGFDATETETCSMVNYVPLTLDFNAYRPSPTGSEIKINFQGNYFSSSFGSVSNTLSLSWKYRVKGASTWTNGGTFVKDTNYRISGNRYSSIGDISLGNIFDYQTNYEICIYYSDKLINTQISKTVPKGQPILSWEEDMVKVNTNLDVLNKIFVRDIKGKNLFDYNQVGTIGSLTQYNGEFSFNSTFWYGYFQYDYSFKINQPYTLSFDIMETSMPAGATFLYFYTDGSYDEVNIDCVSKGRYSITLAPKKTVDFAEFRFFRLNNNTTQRTGRVGNIQLEESVNASDYIPYRKYDCNDLIKFKSVKLTFDTTGASIGDFLNARTTNNYPGINGMSAVGIIPNIVSYGDKNFFTSLNLRDGKVHGQIRVGYKVSSDPILTGWAYIIYVNGNYIDENSLT